MATPEGFELESAGIGALPIVQHFFERMGLRETLNAYLVNNDARLRLDPAVVIAVLVANIIISHRPLYGISEWAGIYEPGLLGLAPGDAEALNDDRVGRMLDRLFDADRASLVTETVLGVVRSFDIDLAQLHNDSTTVTFTGAYGEADGYLRGGKATSAFRHGHNKDFRPDLKQLLYILTISADGAVPIAYRTADGNTSDDVTHIPTWDELALLVGKPGFLYVADSKLGSAEAMGHIDSHGGRFVTIVPHGRKEDTFFKNWVQSHVPDWTEADRKPGARVEDPDRVYRVFEAPIPSTGGYRIIWVHSSAKAAHDAASRSARIEAGLAAIEALQARLSGSKSRVKTKLAATDAGTEALKATRAARWVSCSVTESVEVTYHQERRGRPGASTRYRKKERLHFAITAEVRADNVSYDAVIDGMFPLITNDREMTPAEVLDAYRYQPNLERRNHMLKGPQQVAPVYLNHAHRIEALMLCHFLAMLTEALIEREIRTTMKSEALSAIPLYPELRDCPTPSAPRILEIFNGVQRHHLVDEGQTVRVFDPKLTPLQEQVLDLLHVPVDAYRSASPA
jgi:transposase